MTVVKQERRNELDLVGRWIEENCVVAPGLWTTNHTLYEDFVQFCKDSGQKPYTLVSMAMALAKRGYGARWQRLRRMYLRQHPVCVLCGRPATDVDHILPKRRGGSDDESNLQALCPDCHARKTNQEMRQGRGE